MTFVSDSQEQCLHFNCSPDVFTSGKWDHKSDLHLPLAVKSYSHSQVGPGCWWFWDNLIFYNRKTFSVARCRLVRVLVTYFLTKILFFSKYLTCSTVVFAKSLSTHTSVATIRVDAACTIFTGTAWAFIKI